MIWFTFINPKDFYSHVLCVLFIFVTMLSLNNCIEHVSSHIYVQLNLWLIAFCWIRIESIQMHCASCLSLDIGISLNQLACVSFQNEDSISIAIYLCQVLAKLFNSRGPEEMVAGGCVRSRSCKSQDKTGFRALFESVPRVPLNKWVSLTRAGDDAFLISIALWEGKKSDLWPVLQWVPGRWGVAIIV